MDQEPLPYYAVTYIIIHRFYNINICYKYYFLVYYTTFCNKLEGLTQADTSTLSKYDQNQ